MDLTAGTLGVKQRRPEKPSGTDSGLRELRLRHAIPLSIAGQLAYVLSQMGVLSALSYFRGPAAVGEFGLALALTTPAFMFVSMSGRGSQASDVTQRYSFGEYAAVAILVAVLAVVASVGAGLLFAPSYGALMIVIVVALTKAVEAVSNLSYGAFQQAGRADKVAISLFLRGSMTVALFAALLALGVPTHIAFVAQLLVWSALAFGRDYRLASEIAAGTFVWPSTDRGRLWALVRETAPLGASHAVGALVVSLPRLFVERQLGLSAVGLLTVVGYLQQAGAMLFNAVSQTLVSRFARLRQRNSVNGLRRTVKVLLVAATLCSAVGLVLAVVAGRWALTLLFGPEFAAAETLLVLVAIALCARLYGVIPQTLLHADRRYRSFLIREAMTVLVCLAALWVCVPRWGLTGAGYAILAAAVFRLLFMAMAVVSQRKPTDLDSDLPPDAEPASLP